MFRRTALLLSLALLIALLTFGFLAGTGQTSEASAPVTVPPQTSPQTYHVERVTTAYHSDTSPAVRDLPAAPTEMYTGSKITDMPEGGPLSNASTGKANGFTGDPVAQNVLGPLAIPTPLVSFDGLNNISGVNPPDPDGDVGPNHYVHMTNLSFAVYTKAGAIIGTPHLNNTLWAGFGGPCQTSNSGDPIVLHDQIADRWILTQFTAGGPTYYQCVAVSTTADPTGTYHRYGFNMGNQFGDYPKYAVWPDAYYLSERDFTGGATQNGQGLHALNRAKMLTGDPTAEDVLIRVPFTAGLTYLPGDGLLVADIDGSTLPAAGTPAFVVGSQDNGGPYGAPSDALNLWRFHVDFVTPANSTLTGPTVIPVASFDSIFDPCGGGRACIPQPTTAFKIDILSYRQRVTQRLSYRNMGTYEMLLTGQSVEGAAGIAGMRWYELRDPNGTPFLYQQGTYVPGATDSIHRWMGSLAMDASGNIALGYSASDATSTFPSSAYTGRLAGDPLGTMPQGEAFFKVGTGSETGGGSRWGDYTAMHVDPTDDCTFWYVNEYIPTTSASGWRGTIGAFKFPGCSGGTPTPTPTNTATSTPTTAPTDTPTNTPIFTSTPLPPTETPTNVPPTETSTPTETPTGGVPTATACALLFTDVPVGSTFYDNIRCLSCRGIINGYSSGCETGDPCFRPSNNVTRGQLSKIVSNSAGFLEPATDQQYEDVPVGSTFHEFIWRLTVRSYVNGYPCGGPGEPCGAGSLPYFRPNNNVTRGQLSKIVANGAGLSDPAGAQQFEDVVPGSTFYDFIWRLTDLGVMSGYPCGGAGEPCVSPGDLPYFRPSANATRGQASKIVANTFFPGCTTPSR